MNKLLKSNKLIQFFEDVLDQGDCTWQRKYLVIIEEQMALELSLYCRMINMPDGGLECLAANSTCTRGSIGPQTRD